MKKIVLFLGIIVGITSCSIDNDDTTFTTEFVPVISVEIPDTLVLRNNYTFEITYNRPTSCHVFKGFSYERNGNERKIAVVNDVYVYESCKELTDESVTVDLNFIVEREDFYVFKFWQGVDEEGESIFLIKEVPVVTGNQP